MSAWYSVATPAEQERLGGAWPDAPTHDLELCGMLLEVAKQQVVAFAPAVPDPAPAGYPSENLVYAQLQQARNLALAGGASAGGELSEGEFSYTPRPLDKTIRGIIRPTYGAPRVR